MSCHHFLSGAAFNKPTILFDSSLFLFIYCVCMFHYRTLGPNMMYDVIARRNEAKERQIVNLFPFQYLCLFVSANLICESTPAASVSVFLLATGQGGSQSLPTHCTHRRIRYGEKITIYQRIYKLPFFSFFQWSSLFVFCLLTFSFLCSRWLVNSQLPSTGQFEIHFCSLAEICVDTVHGVRM